MSTFPDTPTTLLTRIAAEISGEADEVAWAEFFRIYEPAMKSFLLRHGIANVEDVVQAVFIKLVPILREKKYDRDRGKFRSYLATLLFREAVSFLRREAARGGGRTVLIEEQEIPSSEDPAEVVDRDWARSFHEAVVHHVLTETALSEQSKTIFAELERTGDSCAEVARRNGLPAATVRQIHCRVSRMVASFEKRFGGEA